MVLRIDLQRRLKRPERPSIVAEPRPGFAERKPSGRKSRRRFDRLGKKIGRGGEIAARREVAAEPIAPVGDQVAR
jgi:hypothetical protein